MNNFDEFIMAMHNKYILKDILNINIARVKGLESDKTFIVKKITNKSELIFKNEPAINDYIKSNIHTCTDNNIICVVDKVYIGNSLYLVMDDVNGISLTSYLTIDEPYETKKEKLYIILKDVINALYVLHTINILHLDIKLDNIIVSPNNRGYLLDFGISCVLLDCKTDCTTIDYACTEDKLIIGTLDYMSPEVKERKISIINKWSDIFSLGRVIAEINKYFIQKYKLICFDLKKNPSIALMFQSDVNKRPTINYLKETNFI